VLPHLLANPLWTKSQKKLRKRVSVCSVNLVSPYLSAESGALLDEKSRDNERILKENKC